MTDLSIPSELYRPILTQIDVHDRKTLRSLALTSQLLNNEANRLLYRNFVSISNIDRHVLFFRTVVSSSRLAKLVESYKMDYGPNHLLDIAHPWWSLLLPALKALVNLKILSFSTFAGRPGIGLLKDCTFQLISLDWGNSATLAYLYPFLISQPSIRYLHIGSLDRGRIGNVPPPHPPQILQNLQALSGDYDIISKFLPGRELSSLRWSPSSPYSDVPIQEFISGSDALSHVHTFTFGGRNPLFSAVAPQLVKVVRLHLINPQVS